MGFVEVEVFVPEFIFVTEETLWLYCLGHSLFFCIFLASLCCAEFFAGGVAFAVG